MTQTVFSQNWFRVVDLKPRLRPHARIHRQRFRGGTWYIVQDEQTGRYHRLAPSANHMIGLMDGRRTMAEIWHAACVWAGAEGNTPTQDEVIKLLAQLHHSDLLSGDLSPDIDELARRADKKETKALVARIKNPLALRLPLWDPDRFLTVTLPFAKWAFSWFGLLLWLAVVGTGAVLAALNWQELTTGLADHIFLAENLLILALVYPVVKLLHELGHGYAVKAWGGEVREVGFMFLVLIPVPYVDASSSSTFSSKWQRALVAGAGILVELFIAGFAMIVWVLAEPGILRAAAFNAALIGSVSTLLFNGNPLLRFDGYYVFSDLLEIPNLGTRSNKHFFHVIKRYIFGMRSQTSPATADGERFWFFTYAVASFFYRMAIMVGVALFVAGQFFFIGVALAIWAVFNAIIMPLLKGLWWLIEAPELRGNRLRAVTLTGAALAAVLAALLVMPVPLATRVDGVVGVPESAVLNVEGEGFVANIHAGGDVVAGEPVLWLKDPALAIERDLLRAQRAEIVLRLERELTRELTEAQLLRVQLTHADAAIARVEEQLASLVTHAPRDGRLLISASGDFEGRYVERGGLLGYIVTPEEPIIQVAVDQRRADLVRRRLQQVEVTSVSNVLERASVEVTAVTPQATRLLPSPVLGTEGGGRIVLDPQAGDAITALDPHFLFELSGSLPADMLTVGQRVHVRFHHGEEPFGYRVFRQVRQVFLRQFDV